MATGAGLPPEADRGAPLDGNGVWQYLAGAPAPITKAGQPPLIWLCAAAATRAPSSKPQPTTNSRGPSSPRLHGHRKSAAVTADISPKTPAASPPANPQLAASTQVIARQ
jgi:hypothetical protein